MRQSIKALHTKKQTQDKITCLTAYDASFAALQAKAGVDIVLIGDSLGNVIQGKSDTLSVTVDDVAYHTKAVARGNRESFLIADMPFLSDFDVKTAFENAKTLIQAGAQAVKLEGGANIAPVVHALTERGVVVCGHIGLQPQFVHKLGGYAVQGKTDAAREQVIRDATVLERAGCSLMVLECVPADLAQEITEMLHIPTIGIGAGDKTDGQVLVMHDMLGMNPKPAKFVRNFLTQQTSIQGAFENFVSAVKSGDFPAAAEQYCVTTQTDTKQANTAKTAANSETTLENA